MFRLLKQHVFSLKTIPSTRNSLRLAPKSTRPLKLLHMLFSDLVRQIPRYFSTLDDNPGYYPVGHDTVCSLVDDAMMRRAANGTILLFFGGIGDARSLYATLTEITRFGDTDGDRRKVSCYSQRSQRVDASTKSCDVLPRGRFSQYNALQQSSRDRALNGLIVSLCRSDRSSLRCAKALRCNQAGCKRPFLWRGSFDMGSRR